jgi:hypothetical protein
MKSSCITLSGKDHRNSKGIETGYVKLNEEEDGCMYYLKDLKSELM